MKKWIKGFLAASFMLFAATLGLTALTSCNHESGNRKIKNSDSAFVVGIVEKYCHPEMSSVDEAVMLQQQMSMDADYERVFINMSPKTLEAVVHVMTHKNNASIFTIKDIAQEYLSSQKVYDNLPGNEQESDVVSKPKVLDEPDSIGGGKQYGDKSYRNSL